MRFLTNCVGTSDEGVSEARRGRQYVRVQLLTMTATGIINMPRASMIELWVQVGHLPDGIRLDTIRKELFTSMQRDHCADVALKAREVGI